MEAQRPTQKEEQMEGFSNREMYEQAAGNCVALLVAADKFLRSRGIDPAEFYRFFGESYASDWDRRKGDIEGTVQSVALNMTSAGFDASPVTENGAVTVHSRWTEQHEDSEWPTSVKPVLENAIPLLFEAPMAHAGVQMTAAKSSEGVDLRIVARERM
jgi:hypothetical protein